MEQDVDVRDVIEDGDLTIVYYVNQTNLLMYKMHYVKQV